MDENFERMGLIFQTIRDYYHSSGSYNGIEFNQLRELIGCTVEELAGDLAILVIFQGMISVVATSHFANPYVKAFDDLPVDEQIQILDTGGHEITTCLYPTERALAQIVGETELIDQPFTRKLHLGEPQLRFYTFELNVLASYQDDPRYSLDFDGISGRIHLRDEFFDQPETYERDKTFLRSFGLTYAESNSKAIAVYLRYLAELTPEHQQIWNTKLVKGNSKLHPDFYKQTILGEWGDSVSIFSAFVGEIRVINEMSDLIGKPRLFRFTYADGNDRPKGLEPLYRSTSKAYYDFAHLIDKMLSDDINKDFFRDELDLEEEIERKDGRIEVRQKGTIRLLEEWLNKNELDDLSMITDAFAKLRRIRKERQYPAHKILGRVDFFI